MESYVDTMSSDDGSGDGSGAVLIIPDVPLGLDFGINCMSFETGLKFRGMSMIPPGLHFIYHSTGMAARQGFFLRVGLDDVAVRQWDSFEEHICASDTLSEASMATLIQQLRRGDLNGNLGPYPVAEHHIWKNLSCFIYENVLLRACCPIGEIIYPSEAHNLAALSSSISPNSRKFEKKDTPPRDESLLQGNFAKFVDITGVEARLRDKINASDTGDQVRRANNLTSLFIDKSSVLDHLVETEYNLSWENVLGEIQLSFMLFLLIFCYDALEHWKRLVDTICRSEKALIAKQDFAIAFMRILYEQLNFAPADFFANELSKDNFLRPAISALFENLKQPKGVLNSSVLEHKKRLLNFFQKKFNLFVDNEGDFNVKMRNLNMNMNSDDYNLVDEDKPMILGQDELEAFEHRTLNNNEEIETNHIKTQEIIVDDNTDVSGDKENMTLAQIEIHMFCWRYPNLYDSMRADLNEDMEMAAVRILSEMEEEAEGSSLNKGGKDGKGGKVVNGVKALPGISLQARAEARMFLEGEVSKRTAIE